MIRNLRLLPTLFKGGLTSPRAADHMASKAFNAQFERSAGFSRSGFQRSLRDSLESPAAISAASDRATRLDSVL